MNGSADLANGIGIRVIPDRIIVIQATSYEACSPHRKSVGVSSGGIACLRRPTRCAIAQHSISGNNVIDPNGPCDPIPKS